MSRRTGQGRTGQDSMRTGWGMTWRQGKKRSWTKEEEESLQHITPKHSTGQDRTGEEWRHKEM